MFEICNQPYPICTESIDEAYDNNNADNITLAAPLVTDGTSKEFFAAWIGTVPLSTTVLLLPRLKKSVLPSWVIDQLHRAQDRLGVS